MTATFGTVPARSSDVLDVAVLLPEELYATLGKPLTLYHDNALLVPDGGLAGYTFSWSARYATGVQDAEKFVVSPPHDDATICLRATDGGAREWSSSARVRCVRPMQPIATGKKLLIVGDSITAGVAAVNFVDHLRSQLQRDSWTLIGSKATVLGSPHEGVVGATWAWHQTDAASAMVNGGVLDLEHYISAHLGAVPDVVIFALGTNDMGSADPDDPDTAIDTMFTSVDSMLAAWAAAAPVARLYVTALQPGNGTASTFVGTGFARDEWKAIQSRMVQRLRTKFAGTGNLVPLHPSFDPLLGYDAAPPGATATHPNAVGHAALATQIEAFLRYQFRT